MVFDIIVHFAGNEDPSRYTERFDTGGHIHTIPIGFLFAEGNISGMNADADRHRRILFQSLLQGHTTFYCSGSAGKYAQSAIAKVLKDLSAEALM